MWTIETAGGAESRRQVRFGSHRIALKDIEGISMEEVRDRQAIGLFAGAAIFIFVSAAFAYFVFEQGARERFLIAAVFLSGLGIAGLIEASRLKAVRHYELTLTLANGERVVFTSPDLIEVQALALRLTAERGE